MAGHTRCGLRDTPRRRRAICCPDALHSDVGRPRMRLLFTLVFVSMLAPAGPALSARAPAPPRSAPPVRPSSAEADSLRAAYAADRSRTEQELKESPTSYLAAVARKDFGDKTSLVVGRAADCDLRLDDPELAAHQ